MDIDDILKDARRLKAKELVHQYRQREPDAVTLVDELLENAGASIEALTADAIPEEFEYIERIDRLITIAETRRNASSPRSNGVRRFLAKHSDGASTEIEEGEFEVIEAPRKGKNAA